MLFSLYRSYFPYRGLIFCIKAYIFAAALAFVFLFKGSDKALKAYFKDYFRGHFKEFWGAMKALIWFLVFIRLYEGL